jgi:hypothetical protein
MNNQTETCPACKGNSLVHNVKDGTLQRCPLCDGDGEVPKKYNRRPYDFSFPACIVPKNGQNSVSIQAPGDFDFEWWDNVAVATSSSVYVLLEINDVRFMNSLQPGNGNGIPLDNWAGTAQLPYSRRFPFVISARDQATLYFTDFSGFTNTVTVTLKGHQLIPAKTKSQSTAQSS